MKGVAEGVLASERKSSGSTSPRGVERRLRSSIAALEGRPRLRRMGTGVNGTGVGGLLGSWVSTSWSMSFSRGVEGEVSSMALWGETLREGGKDGGSASAAIGYC